PRPGEPAAPLPAALPRPPRQHRLRPRPAAGLLAGSGPVGGGGGPDGRARAVAPARGGRDRWARGGLRAAGGVAELLSLHVLRHAPGRPGLRGAVRPAGRGRAPTLLAGGWGEGAGVVAGRAGADLRAGAD